MAKVPFSKLNLKFDKDDKTIININGIEVEVLKYLPQAQKSELVEYILDNEHWIASMRAHQLEENVCV